MTDRLFSGAARERLVLALDVPSLARARALAELLAPEVGMLKIGLELFVEAGSAAVRMGESLRRPVFLDLKMHDIPETVERAVARACALGVRMLTVHASGGPAMLERAASRAAQENTGLSIAAVTVLTSLDASDLVKIGVDQGPADHARRLARMAFDAGVRAFICSPDEAAVLRAELGAEAVLVTPGIRLTALGDDQKRVKTARMAIEAGADALVVGRPIRDASDPVLAARAIASEIAQALSQ